MIFFQEALTDVAHWLEHHTNEVVIISLSAFNDVSPVQHYNLIDFLIQLFGKKLCPKSVSSRIFYKQSTKMCQFIDLLT